LIQLQPAVEIAHDASIIGIIVSLDRFIGSSPSERDGVKSLPLVIDQSRDYLSVEREIGPIPPAVANRRMGKRKRKAF
jgi:hypothetical protein